jgi:hypothetical protein
MPTPAKAALATLLACAALVSPAAGLAAIVRFGSPLRARASLTTNDLGYQGINTPWGAGVVHTAHDGADTALWNAAVAEGSPSAPATGQVTSVSLEGCAEPAKGGPAPLTQIHFQALAPQGAGTTKVELTSQAFDIPVCGSGGVSASTISTYRPQGLCVAKGDYVGFNDEGGFVETYYRAGVPYRVIAAVRGSRMNAFLMGGGTGNGAIFSPSVTGAADGFVSDTRQELLLRATLATGRDSVSYCRG